MADGRIEESLLQEISFLRQDIKEVRQDLKDTDRRYDGLRDKIDETRKGIIDRVDELEDKTSEEIKNIQIKLVSTANPAPCAPTSNCNDDWWNSKVGKFANYTLSSMFIFCIYKILDLLFEYKKG